MRLTLEPTEKPLPGVNHPKVTIEIPGDDHDMEEVIETLVRPVLLGFGFGPETIDRWIPREDSE